MQVVDTERKPKAAYQKCLEMKENKKEEAHINTNSTADNSQEDSLLSLKSEFADFPMTFNKYFMSLKPLRPLVSTAKANVENLNPNLNFAFHPDMNVAAGAFDFKNAANGFIEKNNLYSFNSCENAHNDLNFPNGSNFNLNNSSRCNSNNINNNTNNNFNDNYKNNDLNLNSNLNFNTNLKSSNTKQLFSNFPNKLFKKTIIPLEIFQDLFDSLIEEEHSRSPSFGYMQSQTDINEKMRAVLIDWLSEVHLKFKLFPETIFLTVNIIDRYLSQKTILKNHLQLCGVAALLIACKYEEIFCPDISDLVYITDKAYRKEEIIFMEKEILNTLNYEITVPTPVKFYDLLAVNFGFDETEYYLGRFFLEIFLMDYRINKYQNSLVACAVVYLVLKINKYEDYRVINCYALSAEKDLKNCAKEICFLVENIDSTNLLSIKSKYAAKEFHEVSKIIFK